MASHGLGNLKIVLSKLNWERHSMHMKNMPLAQKAFLAMTALSCMACVTFAADGKIKTSDSTFAPAVTTDSTLVLGVNFSRQQLFKIADDIVSRMLKMPEADKRSIDEVRRKIDAFKRDPLEEAPKDVCDALEECGLRNVYPRWAVLSLEGPLQIVDDSLTLDQMALAISADMDLGKTISVIQKKMAEMGGDSASFQEISVGNEKAWQIVPKDSDVAMKMRSANVNPHLASLDGKLLLLAMSRNILEKQIRLYRKGEGKRDSDASHGFSAADGELLRFHVSGIGSMIKGRVSFPAMRNTKQGGLAEVASIIEEIVTGLQTLSVDINVLQGGTVGLNMCLEAATEDDAELIRTLVGAVLVIAKTFVSRSPEMPKEAVDALKSLHIGGLDNKIELRCADVMLILGKSLFPAVLSARRSANTPTMSMKGRNLFLAITQANIEREAAGLAAIWPRTSASDDEDKNDIAGKTYLKSTDYFKDLFDMPNHGKAEWTPYVNCDMDVVGKDFDLWCVAANITDKTPDCIPVLISANFNPELLTLKWDGSLNRKTLLPIGPAHGAVKSPLGDKAITVVRKDGSAQIINANDLTYETLYKGQPFDLTNAETPVIYLTPKGIATPATRR